MSWGGSGRLVDDESDPRCSLYAMSVRVCRDRCSVCVVAWERVGRASVGDAAARAVVGVEWRAESVARRVDRTSSLSITGEEVLWGVESVTLKTGQQSVAAREGTAR